MAVRVSHAQVLLPTPRRCGCGVRVRWVHGLDGGRRLIDAEPSREGYLMLVLTEGKWVAERRRGYRAKDLQAMGLELYRYHSCA